MLPNGKSRGYARNLSKAERYGNSLTRRALLLCVISLSSSMLPMRKTAFQPHGSSAIRRTRRKYRRINILASTGTDGPRTTGESVVKKTHGEDSS